MCVCVCVQVLNSGPSRAINTVVDIALPKILPPYRHRLLQVVDWKVCPNGSCSGSRSWSCFVSTETICSVCGSSAIQGGAEIGQANRKKK